MDLIKRPACIFSGNEDLELLYTFKDTPVYCAMADLNSDYREDLVSDMSMWISKSTGSLQLNPLIPFDILYQQQHNDAIGKTWLEHHKQFAKFVEKFKPNKVLEIGGGASALSRIYLESNPGCEWIVVEPNAELLKGREDITVIESQFDDKVIIPDVDVVVHTHFLEHLYDPLKFVQTVSEKTSLDCLHLFSIPDFDYWLKSKFGNTLFFEHTYYLDKPFAAQLLACGGYHLLDTYNFKNHSIFYAAENIKTFQEYTHKSRYEELKLIYSEYLDYLNDNVSAINKQISHINSLVFVFGAHIFSQILLVRGMDRRNICGILDNSKMKIGKRLYGTPYEIFSPETIKGVDAPIVVLFAGAYLEEIKKQLLEINNTVKLIIL